MSERGVATRGSTENPVSRAGLVPEADFVGTVHSVFATACNLEVGDRMIVVHDAAKAHTPTSVRVTTTGAGPWSPVTRRGDDVTQRGGVLSFGEHVLPLRHLPVWTPRPRLDSAPLRSTPLRSTTLWTAHRQSTVIASVEAAWASHAAPLDPRLVHGVRTLRTEIADAMQPAAAQGAVDNEIGDRVDQAVRRLIGFGPGLTPAGDDVLVGLLAVLDRRRDEPGTWRALTDLHTAIRRYTHRTTDVSAHYLRLAVQGHFGESLEELLDAIDAQAPAATLHTRTAEVLSLGSTSGSDTVRGLLVGLDLIIDNPHHPHLQEDAA